MNSKLFTLYLQQGEIARTGAIFAVYFNKHNLLNAELPRILPDTGVWYKEGRVIKWERHLSCRVVRSPSWIVLFLHFKTRSPGSVSSSNEAFPSARVINVRCCNYFIANWSWSHISPGVGIIDCVLSERSGRLECVLASTGAVINWMLLWFGVSQPHRLGVLPQSSGGWGALYTPMLKQNNSNVPLSKVKSFLV